MKKLRVLFTVVVAVLGGLVFADRVSAAPVAVISPPASTSVHVGDMVTFDASSSSCSPGLSCTYKWVESYRNPRTFATVTIAQRGTGRSTSITFTAADATRDYVTVQLIVTDNNSTHNFRSDQINMTVSPAPTDPPSAGPLGFVARSSLLSTSALRALRAGYPCPYGYVLFGEFQTVPNLTPPCRLDLGMYNGTYHGLTVVQRCNNFGGYLVVVSGTKVCRDVDY